MQFCLELKQLHPEWICDIVSMLIVANGLVIKDLLMNLKKIGVQNVKRTVKDVNKSFYVQSKFWKVRQKVKGYLGKV